MKTLIWPSLISHMAEIEEIDCRHTATASLASGYDTVLSFGEKLATGSFGSVSEATFRGESGWVVKTSTSTKDKYSVEMINREIVVLKDMQGVRGFPVLRAVVRDADAVQLVIQRLPHTLADLSHIAPLPSEDVYRIAVQVLDALEAMHDKGWIHRDIKPDNTMFDDRAGTVYLIDFGLAKKIVDEKGVHIPDLKTSKITGTPRYCSVPVHQGHTASRRDDLESLVYSLQFVLDGHLPWSGAKLKRDNNYAAHLRKKLEVGSRIFAGPLLDAYNHVRSLRFDQRPDYALLREAFMREIPGSSRTKLTQFRYLSRELEIGRPTRRRLDDIKAIAQVAIRGLRSKPKLRARILDTMPESDRVNWALLAHNDPSASVSLGSSVKDDDSGAKKPKPEAKKAETYTVGVQNLLCDTTVVFRLKVLAPPSETKYTFTNSSRILWCRILQTKDLVSLCAVNVLTGSHRYYRFDPNGPIAKIPWRCVFVSWSGCLVRYSDREIDLVTFDPAPLSVEVGTEATINSSGTCQVNRVSADHPIKTPWLMTADGASILVLHVPTADTWNGSWQVFVTSEPQGNVTLRLQQEFKVKYLDDPLGTVFSHVTSTLAVWFADHVVFHQLLADSNDEPTSKVVSFAGCRRALVYGLYWILFNDTEIVFVDAKSLILHPRRIIFSGRIHDLSVSNESVLVGHDSTARITHGEDMVRTPTQQVQLWGNCNRLVIGAPRCLLVGHRHVDSSLRTTVSSLIIDVSTLASSSAAKRRLDFEEASLSSEIATEKHLRVEEQM